jgi:hypothetical protein
MPAAYLFKPLEQPAADEVYGALRYVLHYILLVYINADPAPDTVGETIENMIADAVDHAVNNDGQPQTLGNIVNNVWSEGICDFGLNAVGNQIWFAIAIKVETGS